MKKTVAGIGLVGVCTLCCLFPPLLIGLAGIAGIGLGFWKWGLVLSALSLVVYLLTRKTYQYNKNEDCDCSKSCKTYNS
ncbi:hypothetical protein [Alkalihalobacillus sp. AL-G]|uniref:hypothetical protein n=1 Tax=Alkalihalobacillus sp. AL-G TaxID=2926399 RepID=UPI002729C2FE|nr:hypothetical protein [Alkalihalobacillus sp. AL-G]WLD92564.1 MerC domain-containing protein [Alkalihalobacillus sp. AL-G]